MAEAMIDFGRSWSPDEDRFIQENYPHLSMQEIGDHLGRTRKAVNNRAYRLRARGIEISTHTYMPGALRVPCATCGTSFLRVKDHSNYQQKYCSTKCKTRAKRKDSYRDYSICPKCKNRPRAQKSNGKLRSWCKPCEALDKKKYNDSEAGKTARLRYRNKLLAEGTS